MKKHFLLFVLMTLLPLAAWAETDISGATVTFASKTYQGDDTTAPTETVKVGETTLTRGSDYTIAYYSDAECTQAATIRNAGTYYAEIRGAGDYEGYKSGLSFNIKKASLSVTIGNASKVYGTPDSDVELLWAPSSSFKPGDDEDNVIITGMTISRFDPSENVGYYNFTVSGATSQNYTIVTSGTSNLTITPKEVGLTWTNTSLTYNGTAQAPTATATDLVGQDVVNVIVTGAQTNVGSYTATASALDNANYKLPAAKTQGFTIGAKEIGLTWTNTTLTYNGTAQAPTATATGLETGDVVNVTVTGGQTNAGSHTATASALDNTNYKLPTANTQQFTIGQKEVGLTWTNTSLTYNKKAQAPTATATGLETGDVTSVTVTGAQTNVGSYTATASGLSNTNYKLPSSATQEFAITAKALTISAEAKSKTYGANDPPLTFTQSGLVAGDAITGSLSRDAGENIGTYTINQNNLTAGNNYTITYNSALLTITVATATVTADAKSKTYGAADPALTATVTGLKNGDAANVISYTISRAAGENVGTWTITPAGEATQGNYNVTYVPANLTINKKALTITADDKSKTYGEADPTLTVSYDGFIDGESNTNLTTQPTVTRAAGNDVGTYTITASGAASGNYDISYVQGTLTINPKGIIITAENKSKIYGEDDPAFTYTVIGLEEGDAITTPPTFAREAGNIVGTYAITPSAAVAGNYSITYVNGTLTINPAPITLKAKDQTIPQGGSISNTVNDVTITSGALKYTDALTAFNINLTKTKTAVGTHTGDITLTASNANYTITTLAGNLTITAAATLALVDNDDAFQLIKDYAGQTLPVTIKFAARNKHRGYGSNPSETYPWKAERWTTLVLPFDISVADLSKALGYAVVNVIDPSRTHVSGTSSEFYGKFTMKGGNDYHAGQADADTKLAANKPILLKIADAIDPTKDYDFGSQTIVAPADLTMNAGGGATFVGTYANKTVTGTDGATTIWFMNGNEDGWQYIDSGSSSSWTIVPFEAYIDMSASSASEMVFYFEDIDGSVTAIKSVDADKMNRKLNAEGWYTLNGVKLQNAPTEKGIYIKDGKKVVIK